MQKNKFWKSLGLPQVALLATIALAAIGGAYVLWKDFFEPELPELEVSMFMDDKMTTWVPTDEEFFQRPLPTPIQRNLVSYYGGANATIIVPWLWAGNVLADTSGLERQLFRVIPAIVRARRDYRTNGPRTDWLDKVWGYFPDERRMEPDMEAFGRFVAELYPLHGIADTAYHAHRDELIASVAAHWQPAPTERDNASYTINLFRKILLWMTDPVFRLRISHPATRNRDIRSVAVVVEAFLAVAEVGVSGPIETVADVQFSLDGYDTKEFPEIVDVAIGAGE